MREVYRTDRLAVSSGAEDEVYALGLPTDFDEVYKVNTAVVHVYRQGTEEPFESLELDFVDDRVADMEDYRLPGDQYKDCEFVMVFAYKPAWGLPYEPVREDVRELEPVERFDRPRSEVKLSYDPDDIEADYLSVDVRNPATDEYVAGGVHRIEPSEGIEELLQPTHLNVYPREYAGDEAEITYFTDPQ